MVIYHSMIMPSHHCKKTVDGFFVDKLLSYISVRLCLISLTKGQSHFRDKISISVDVSETPVEATRQRTWQ